jgi:ferredoxin
VTDTTPLVFRGTPEAEDARRAREAELAGSPAPPRLTADWLRRLCLDSGADDAGFVEIGRTALGDENDHARRLFPAVATLICLVSVTNREAIRSVSRPTANDAWHRSGERLDRAADAILRGLAEQGVRGLAATIGFPMDMHAGDGRNIWEIAHKTVAVEAGMGHMGVNRNVIHPRFGNFVLLNTVLIDATLDEYGEPLDYNPCLGCNLCVAACPVGAIHTDGGFDGFACLNHNYREFLFGFTDWIDTLAASGDVTTYRAKFREPETLSIWQSLSFGANYKSAYCQAVCPAGEDVIGPYLTDKKRWRDDIVLPLIHRAEPVYVASGTPAEQAARRKRAKSLRYVDFRPDLSTVDNLLLGIRHRFDRTRATAAQVAVAIEFRLPDGVAAVRIDRGKIEVAGGALERPDAVVTCRAPDYIRLLHPRTPGADLEVPVEITGDHTALDRLLDCLA